MHLTIQALGTARTLVAALLLATLCACGGAENPPSMSTSDPGPLMNATPLRPDQILESTPQTHTHDLYESGDGNLFVAYWSASAGRFTWDYTDIIEVITILEGEAFVTTADKVTHHLKPGVTLVFRAGDHAEWNVPNYHRKVAVVHRSPRPFLQRVGDKLKKLVN